MAFTPNDSIGELLGFKPKVINEDYNLSDYSVDFLSFDNIFLETDITQGVIFEGNEVVFFRIGQWQLVLATNM